jgi:hypothetical protein
MSQFPPVSSDFQIPQPPPAWPKVIGIISIVLGSLGVICNACSLGGNAIASSFTQMMPPEQQAELQAQLQASASPLNLALAAVGILIAILLIVAGVFLVQRRPLGRTLHLIYAGIGLILAIAAVGIGIQTANAMAANAPDPTQAAAQRMAGLGGAIVGGLVGAAYPTFLLIWFLFIKRDAASMGSSNQEPLV